MGEYISPIDRQFERDSKQLGNYLDSKKSLFLRTRRAFGIGTTVGLAFWPGYHAYYTSGTIIPIKVIHRKWYAPPTSMLGAPLFSDPYVEFTEGPQANMIIRPVGSKSLYVVSLYPKRGPPEHGLLERRLFKTRDDVLLGLIAHEFAEYLLNFNEAEIPKAKLQALRQIRTPDTQIAKQSRADLLASLYGYKQQILAYLTFAERRLRSYEYHDLNLIREPDDLISELQERIRLLKQYS